MKKYLFSFLLVCISLFGQPRDKFPAFIPIIPFETQVISFQKTNSDFSVYYTYKIPYSLLVFERQGESFLASFRITIEISDNDGKLVARDIKDNKLSVPNFESTNAPGLFLEDFLNFSIKKNDYKVLAIISDLNSSGDRPLKPINLNLAEDENKVVLHPIVVKPEEFNCNEQNSFIMSNSGGRIPFSLEEFNLIIPVTDTSLTELEVTLENNGEKISTITLNESYIEPFGISKCEDKILLTKSSENSPTRNFIIRDINKKLNEGDLTLTFRNEGKNVDEKIEMSVVWFNKPISLFDPEKAIEYLSFIEPDSVVDDLLSADEEDYPKVLQNYWKKFDPTPESSFNEIMLEYYSRIDYAMREFSSLNNNNGAKSDRGVVYIRYGQPNNIDRTSSSQGEVIEIWTYSNPQRKFTFIDKIGTGNFTLTEN